MYYIILLQLNPCDLIERDGGLSTLCHSCGFACQQRVLKTFPGPGYLCSEDGVVWLWHLLVYNIGIDIHIISWNFVVLHQKISIFINFISLLIKYPQQNINQSETRTGDDKLSVELYEWKLQASLLSQQKSTLFCMKFITEGTGTEGIKNEWCSICLGISKSLKIWLCGLC